MWYVTEMGYLYLYLLGQYLYLYLYYAVLDPSLVCDCDCLALLPPPSYDDVMHESEAASRPPVHE